MQDKVELIIDNSRIENFISYSIDADLYMSADAFTLELANPEIEILPGRLCKLIVNDELELVGIIDRVQKNYDKRNIQLKVDGRDLMGLLVDNYVDEFFTVQNMKIKDLAEKLLKKIPFINRKNIIYQENIKGSLKKKKQKETKISEFDIQQNFIQIEPGRTVFEILKEYCTSRGIMFYSLPDGTFVFGKPRTGGNASYYLQSLKSPSLNNNVITGEITNDISERYKTIIVLGQQQSIDSFGQDTHKFNTKAIIEDNTFPFPKTYVTKNNNDEISPKLHAKMLLEQMRFKGFQLQYKVKGHSQNGKNWKINEICSVKDELLGIEGNFLIYQRTFIMTKEGVYTTLKLSYPGVVQ